MANTPKKKTAGTSARGGNTKGKSTTKRRTAPPPPAYNAQARVIGGIVCLLLALCILVTYFNVDAILLTFLAAALKGCFGYGYWLAAPALLYAGVTLLNHKGRPVKLRTACTLLLPVLLGMVLHLLLSRGNYTFSLEGIKPLWKDGQELLCGGAISGSLAVGAEALLSRVVSLILTILLTLIAVLTALQIKPAELIEEVRRRAEERAQWDDEEDDYEDEVPVKTVKAEAVTQQTRKKRPAIDIPLDSEPDAEPSREAAVLKTTSASLFPRRAGDIKTPAEVLNPALAQAAAENPPDQETASAPAPAKEPVSEKKRKEIVRAEVESATAEVSEAIEKELAEGEEAYRYPPITLLDQNSDDRHQEVGAELRLNSQRLAAALTSFGVDAHPGEVVHGPSVTRYEFTLDQGVKLSKLTNLSDDIALALGATGVRIAPIPGKISAVGIEVPNKAVTAVRIRDVIESREFTTNPSTVAFAVGKDIGGNCIIGNIARLPHVLIAGTTGSGKSVCTNSLIVSLLYKSTPDEVRFIMVDPKMVELAPYNGIPHLLIPVVTDPKKAAGALQWAVYEMMKRYKMFSERGVKDLAGFNALCESDAEMKKLPTVVVVIDELADLMLVAAKEVEESICRVAQMGRAAGMHLVIATQRPSADVITGLMKANIPSRIAFAVASSLESRIILDTTGAEKLVGKGDMLYFPLGSNKPTRVQGCFITPEEIERVVNFVKESGTADYSDEVMEKIEEAMKQGEKGGKAGGGSAPSADDGEGCDELLGAAVEVILETGQASVSMLQRRLKLGYSRAARLVDQMEERGIVGPFEGSKPRQLLITKEQWQEMKMKGSFSAGEQEAESRPDPYGSISDVFNSRDALE